LDTAHVAWAGRFIVGGALLLAGVVKVTDPRSFAVTLMRFPISRTILKSYSLAGVTARALPLMEIGVGALLIMGFASPITSLVAVGILSLFSLSIALIVARGEQVSCGCFGGGSSTPVSVNTLGRNMALVACATVGSTNSSISVDAVIRGDLAPSQLAAWTGIGLQCGVLFALAVGLWSIRRAPGFVSHVPAAPSGVGDVWEGVRETRRGR
jgi:uncharacterized membrane protein YphA (DoxX/SURF4 family)